MVILQPFNQSRTDKKPVYKFVNGKLEIKYETAQKAAYYAEIGVGSMLLYLKRKSPKPKKIPADTEYSYSEELPK